MSRESRVDGAGGPLILAIETSTALLGVALIRGVEVLFQESAIRPMAHSSMLLPMCLKALGESGVRIDSVSAVAVSAGPGSFTGLRIGCATAQGLAKAAGKDVVLVPTFEALRRQCGQYPVVALAQGRVKAQTVTALYDGGVEIIPAAARGMEEFLADMRARMDGRPACRVAVAGDAADLFEDLCLKDGRKSSGLEVFSVDERASLPLPATVGLVASVMWSQGLAVNPARAVPAYFRKSQAEALAAKDPSSARDGGGE